MRRRLDNGVCRSQSILTSLKSSPSTPAKYIDISARRPRRVTTARRSRRCCGPQRAAVRTPVSLRPSRRLPEIASPRIWTARPIPIGGALAPNTERYWLRNSSLARETRQLKYPDAHFASPSVAGARPDEIIHHDCCASAWSRADSPRGTALHFLCDSPGLNHWKEISPMPSWVIVDMRSQPGRASWKRLS